jgi:DNA-binding NarL/FixJ family response regulator
MTRSADSLESHGRSTTVLLIDDYEPWRRFAHGEIRNHPRWRAIGEASTGLEAVRLARALQPDLILLDIGLPDIDGIEAARRIRDDRPGARILFLTEQHAPDIAAAAFAAGAGGYLLKSDAGTDLLFAMEAVVNGGRFVAAKLSGRLVLPPQEHHHDAAFHAEEASLVDQYQHFAETALARGSALIFVSSESRRLELQQRLRGRGFATDRLIAEGRCVLLDDEDVLARFMVDGAIDAAAFRAAALPLVVAAQAKSRGRVAAAGDAAGRLFSRGLVDDALRLEQLWDGLSRELHFELLCGYSADVPRLSGLDYAHFQSVCSAHSLVHVR